MLLKIKPLIEGKYIPEKKFQNHENRIAGKRIKYKFARKIKHSTMKSGVDPIIKDLLNSKLADIEKEFNADAFAYYGPILNGIENEVLKIIEDLADEADKKERLAIVLTTSGGSATAVERVVHIVRNHYKEVDFIVPDYAYSAGTIFCMSGDNIYMDYYSVLGPIDPQVQNRDKKWVPALGYLDKVNELLEKSRTGQLTQAEFLILKEIDLAELRQYEQAKELTIELLKKWLVKYKFKNWHIHKSSGQKVTIAEKTNRAKEIADNLSDNNLWKSHSRPINIDTLENDLRLKIEDFSNDKTKRQVIRSYHNLLADFISKNNAPLFIHTRKFI